MCEACLTFSPTVKGILLKLPNDWRLLMRYLPVHPGSAEAIVILESARVQGKLEPVTAALLEAQPDWHDGKMDGAWAAAAKAGLNVAKARAMTTADAKAWMEQDIDDARAVGVHGSPPLFVNGVMLVQPSPEKAAAQAHSVVDAMGLTPGAHRLALRQDGRRRGCRREGRPQRREVARDADRRCDGLDGAGHRRRASSLCPRHPNLLRQWRDACAAQPRTGRGEGSVRGRGDGAMSRRPALGSSAGSGVSLGRGKRAAPATRPAAALARVIHRLVFGRDIHSAFNDEGGVCRS